MPHPTVIFVDVDDTFVRSASHARVPMPDVIEAIQRLYRDGAALYCWSSGGADYARRSAEEFGIAECFMAFLPKPHIMLDDVAVTDWRRLRHVHPNAASGIQIASAQAPGAVEPAAVIKWKSRGRRRFGRRGRGGSEHVGGAAVAARLP